MFVTLKSSNCRIDLQRYHAHILLECVLVDTEDKTLRKMKYHLLYVCGDTYQIFWCWYN